MTDRCGESVSHYETVRQRKDGTLIDISLTVSPVCDASGRVMAGSGSALTPSVVRLLRRLAIQTADLDAADARRRLTHVLTHDRVEKIAALVDGLDANLLV